MSNAGYGEHGYDYNRDYNMYSRDHSGGRDFDSGYRDRGYRDRGYDERPSGRDYGMRDYGMRDDGMRDDGMRGFDRGRDDRGRDDRGYDRDYHDGDRNFNYTDRTGDRGYPGNEWRPADDRYGHPAGHYGRDDYERRSRTGYDSSRRMDRDDVGRFAGENRGRWR
jgi:hypothetical protein